MTCIPGSEFVWREYGPSICEPVSNSTLSWPHELGCEFGELFVHYLFPSLWPYTGCPEWPVCRRGELISAVPDCVLDVSLLQIAALLVVWLVAASAFRPTLFRYTATWVLILELINAEFSALQFLLAWACFKLFDSKRTPDLQLSAPNVVMLLAVGLRWFFGLNVYQTHYETRWAFTLWHHTAYALLLPFVPALLDRFGKLEAK